MVLRPLAPEDKTLLGDAFERLSPDSRYRRFFAPMPRVSQAALSWLSELDYHNQFAWGALVGEDAQEALVGVSRYVRLTHLPQAAEAAVAVIDPYQSRGIGTLLINALVLEAIESGICWFEGYVLVDNHPMLKLLRRVDARIHPDDPQTLRFKLDLPRVGEALTASPVYHVLRAIARGEADLYQREPCPWIQRPGRD